LSNGLPKPDLFSRISLFYGPTRSNASPYRQWPKNTVKPQLLALNRLCELVFREGSWQEGKKDHPRHLTSKPAGLKYRQFPANSPEPLEQGVQHPDL
jgi:hypothetical protein